MSEFSTVLSFNNASPRKIRNYDKLEAIGNGFKIWNQCLWNEYSPGSYMSANKQLVAFKSWSLFCV